MRFLMRKPLVQYLVDKGKVGNYVNQNLVSPRIHISDHNKGCDSMQLPKRTVLTGHQQLMKGSF